MNLLLLVLESFHACTNTPSRETSWVLLGLACFFDINKAYLPIYLTTYLSQRTCRSYNYYTTNSAPDPVTKITTLDQSQRLFDRLVQTLLAKYGHFDLHLSQKIFLANQNAPNQRLFHTSFSYRCLLRTVNRLGKLFCWRNIRTNEKSLRYRDTRKFLAHVHKVSEICTQRFPSKAPFKPIESICCKFANATRF